MSDLDNEVKIPSIEPEKLFTVIEGKKVEVVELPNIKDEPEPAVHYHNDLDQPAININTDITGSLAHTDLTGVTANQHHAQLHVTAHLSGGGDDLSGGTIASLNINSGTFTTPTIGTPSLTGGTLNPILYKAGGTTGVDGTAVYVKTVDFGASTVTYGTIVATKGIVTSLS